MNYKLSLARQGRGELASLLPNAEANSASADIPFCDQFCLKKCLQAYKLDLDLKRDWLRLVTAVQSPTQRHTHLSNPAATRKQKLPVANVRGCHCRKDERSRTRDLRGNV